MLNRSGFERERSYVTKSVISMEENSDIHEAIRNIVEQWEIVVAARYCYTQNIPSEELTKKVEAAANRLTNNDIANVLRVGARIYRLNTIEQVKLLDDTTSCLLMQFHSHANFCKIFTHAINTVHNLLNIALTQGQQVKQKALHTDQVINEEKLSEFEKLECSVFNFLTSFLLAASKIPSIDFDGISLDLVSVIFHYLKHDHPTSVRACAGDILAALSTSPRHCQVINDMFWQQFDLCKKDDDFRNFAAWIDGITKLHLALSPEPLEKITLSFFDSFLERSKKMERGVLRLKFLDALAVLIKTINQTPESNTHARYKELQNQVWDTAVKWSSKSKHTAFCMTFLTRILACSSPSFFIDGHAKGFVELMNKYVKSGDNEMLKLVSDFIRLTPPEFYKSRVEEFTKLVSQNVMPLLFSGNEKKRQLRFPDQDGTTLTLKVVTEIGAKSMMILVDFVRSVLQVPEPNNDHRRVRLVCIQAVAELANSQPELIGVYNNQLFPLIEPALLGTNPELAEEVGCAVPTFPLIHSMNEEKLSQVCEKLYGFSIVDGPMMGTSMHALAQFFEKVVTLQFSAPEPIKYLNKELDRLEKADMREANHILLYMTNILTAYANGLEKIKFDDVAGSKLTAAIWNQFRQRVDLLITPFLFSPDKDIASVATEFLNIFNNRGIAVLEYAFVDKDYDNLEEGASIPYNLTAFVNSAESDYLAAAQLMAEKEPQYSHGLFARALKQWEGIKGRIESQHSARLMNLLAILVREDDKDFKQFCFDLYAELKAQPVSQEVIKAIGLIKASLAPLVFSNVAEWTKANAVDPKAFWPATSTIMHAIASRQQLQAELEVEEGLNACFGDFIKMLIGSASPATADGFATNERCLRSFNIFAKLSPNSVSTFQDDSIIEKMLEMAPVAQAALFTVTYPETLLIAMNTAFLYTQYDVNKFKNFAKWVQQFIRQYEKREQVQCLVVQVLTTVLDRNPDLMMEFLHCSYSKFEIISSHFILAIGNVIANHENFLGEHPEASAVVLMTVLVHSTSDSISARQATRKLLCLLVAKEKSIFAEDSSRPLVTVLAPLMPAAYTAQAMQFVHFIKDALQPNLLRECFNILATDYVSIEQPMYPILTMIKELLPAMLSDGSEDSVFETLILLTKNANVSDKGCFPEIFDLWQDFFKHVKEAKPENTKRYFDQLYAFGTERQSLKSKETACAISIIVVFFKVCPAEIVSYCLPPILAYDRHLPDNLESFLAFLDGADVTFEPTIAEIVCSNIISQILLTINSREMFEEHFAKHVAILTFHAIMMYHVDAFAIGPFRPLLDSIVDSALFRFATDTDAFLRNITKCREVSLLNCSTDVEPEYRIVMEPPAKKMLVYDYEAVRVVADLMEERYPGFKDRFFEIVLANAFQVKEGDRAVEPLNVLMAFNEQQTSRSLYFLLLYSLYVIKHNRTELIDALVDNIHKHLVNETLDEEAFDREALPVVIVFLLYITIDVKRSFSLHLIRILADVCRKLAESEHAEEASKALNEFFRTYNGDEYLASLFVKYVADLATLGDRNCEYVIQCLFDLGKLVGVAGGEFNWCFLLAVLVDAVRTNIAKATEQPIKAVLALDGVDYTEMDEFHEFIKDSFKDDRKAVFVVKFYISIFKTFKSNDLYKESTVVSMLHSYVRVTDMQINPSLYDAVLRTVAYVNLVVGEKERAVTGDALWFLIERIRYKPPKEALTLIDANLKLEPVTRKVIGSWRGEKGVAVAPESMPITVMFNLSGSEQNAVTDVMWDFIIERLKEL